MDDNVLFRWSIGFQDTTTLSEHEKKQFHRFLWLAKLSIRSFQNWFKEAEFVVLYNGMDFDGFVQTFESVGVSLLKRPVYYDQRSKLNVEWENPYEFAPMGVWWKWIPFRLDLNKHEIAVDTDIIMLHEPKTWKQWIDGSPEIIVAPDRYDEIKVNTCGDFFNHPILKGKPPANCGIVGQRAGFDFAERFFETTKAVRFGRTVDSKFITEQGAINLWMYSLDIEGIGHTILDFKKNAWTRDFLLFLMNGIEVETVHAVSWHKQIIIGLKSVFENKILNPDYPTSDFVVDLVEGAKKLGVAERQILEQQIARVDHGMEIYLARESLDKS